MLLEIFSEVCSKRRGCFFSSLRANWFNKQSGRTSSLGGCYWCSSAIICWLPTNYLNSGNETHPWVISPVTSSRGTKGASCETVLIANNRGIVLYNDERIAVHFWLEIINGTDCCAVQSHLAKLLREGTWQKTLQKGKAKTSDLIPLLVCRMPEQQFVMICRTGKGRNWLYCDSRVTPSLSVYW